MLMLKKLFILVFLISFAGCSSSSTATDDTDSDDTGLQFISAGDFDSSASQSLSALVRAVTTGVCADLASPITNDDPFLADGLDCDEDGGVVAHVTPSTYAIAFKRITLLGIDADTSDIDLISDTGTLADSEVIEFTEEDGSTTVVTLSPDDLAAGTYSGIESEIYYFEMRFSIGGEDKTVRIYMSDDDFESEGNLGHHQGDITLINDDGTETGWIDSTWSEENVVTTRSEAQNGAGGMDGETGHDRGFFGNVEFWDAEDLDQGSDQDIYGVELLFDDALEMPDPDTITDLTTITATFSIADTFFYEDFAPQGTGFFPASGGEATSEGAAWAPLVPTANLTVE